MARRFVAPLVLTGMLVLTVAILFLIRKVPAGPEQTVMKCIQAVNESNLDLFLSTIDPAKEKLARELRQQLKEVLEQNGLPWDRFLNSLPGLIQLVGNPAPDSWRLDDVHVLDSKLDADLAWITISANLTTRIRDVKETVAKKPRFALHKFDDEGWRIVDIQFGPN
jgi:hypothetical protein